MKNWKKHVGIILMAGIPGMVCAQGSLTPRSGPGPMMKTLDQLEARTPISEATTITQPGSYYLTDHITVSGGDGIIILSDDVTLDLNGFTIASTATGVDGSGILISGSLSNIRIANGFIKGTTTWNGTMFSSSGFDNGIHSFSGSAITISKMVVERCASSGIFLNSGSATVVNDCIVRTCVDYGIVASRVESSTALDCGETAIWSEQVSHCRAVSVLLGNGIEANLVSDSFGSSLYGACGIYATTVQNSYGAASSPFNTACGIYAAASVHNSYGQASSPIGATGIYTLTANNCYGVAISSDSSSVGISADAVLNSYGFSSGGTNGPGYGIDAITVGNSRGYSTRANSASRGILADGLVSDSFAQCDGGHAIAADYAESCRGESINGIGVRVNYSALNCVGISSNHFGLSATIANGSYGKSHFNPGIYASTIDNCYGISVAGEGISGSVVNNSYGISTSNTGISAYCSQNSKGDTATGSYGLSVYSVAIGCTGYHGGNGTGINGYILNSCWGAGTPGASATYKYNMP